MFDWLRYRYQLARLQRRKRQNHRYYSKALLKAKTQNKLPKEWEDLRSEERHELEVINDDIAQLASTYLISVADKYLLPVPEFRVGSEQWEHSDVSNRYRLSHAAILELRSAIRAEKKESSELARSWLAGLTGLIGVIIGLLAIVLGRR